MNRRNIFITFFSFLLFFLVWEVIASSGLYNDRLFPPVSDVLKALTEVIISGELFVDLYVSVIRIVLGFLFGALLGVIFGIISSRMKLIDSSLGKIIHFLSYAPPVALVPLFILWFGIGNSAIIPLITWSVFFPVWFNTMAGVSNLNKKYIWAAKNLGASRLQLWKNVVLPGAMPYVIAGLRMGIGVAFIMLIVGEMAGTFAGLGYRVHLSHLAFRADKMLVGVCVLGLLGFLSDFSFLQITKRIAPWAVKDET